MRRNVTRPMGWWASGKAREHIRAALDRVARSTFPLLMVQASQNPAEFRSVVARADEETARGA